MSSGGDFVVNNTTRAIIKMFFFFFFLLLSSNQLLFFVDSTSAASTTGSSCRSNSIIASSSSSSSASSAAFTTTTTVGRTTRITTIQQQQQQQQQRSRITSSSKTTTSSSTTALWLSSSKPSSSSKSNSSKPNNNKKFYTYLNQDDTDLIRKIGGSKADTYGEMTLRGFQQWLSEYPLSSLSTTTQKSQHQHTHTHTHTQHTFLDLGSGKGSLVVDALTHLNFKSSIGVELSTERHSEALQLVENSITDGKLTQQQQASSSSSIQLICGDISDPLVVKPLLQKATVIWCSNLLFGDQLQTRIASLISTYGGSESCVEMVATLKEFPVQLKGYELQSNKLWLEMSWTAGKELPGHPPLPGHPCNIYLRKNVNK